MVSNQWVPWFAKSDQAIYLTQLDQSLLPDKNWQSRWKEDDFF